MSSIMRKPVDHVNHKASDPLGDEAVVDAIHTVMHLFRSRQHRALKDGPHDLSHMEAKTLGFFARHPGATQRELVLHSGRDKGQVARLIAGLRERELLVAVADDADRRSIRLSVSPAGKAMQAVLGQQARRASAAAVKGLLPDERAQLLALLARVQANLEQGG
jgi:DNA-binding MarR family transcriptional regulator